MQFIGPTAGSPTFAPNRRHGVDQHLQSGGVARVRRGQADREREAAPVHQDLVLPPRLAPVGRVLPRFLPPLLPGPWHLGQWAMTGSMHDPRLQFTMTLLPSGQVLAVGGCRTSDCSVILAGAELYNPRTGTWTVTGSMHTPRVFHTATLLPDGQVLVAGGASNNSDTGITNTTEIYNPRTGRWTMTSAMGDVRARHTATLLANGEVLVAGGAQGTSGNDSGSPTASAELYDPRTSTWSWTGSLNLAREAFTVVRLPSGDVLAASGWGPNTALTSAELYSPRTGAWSMTGSLHEPRNFEASAAAVLLRTGQVLVAGGHGNSPLASAELYSPRTGQWTLTGSMHLARGEQTTTLLANGEVLVAGGSLNFSGSIGLAGAEIYHP